MAAPTAIRLSQATINEREEPGGFVAILATVDVDSADRFSYALVDGENADHNDWFRIQDNRLVNTRVVDREQLSSLTIRLRSTDSSGQSVEQAFRLDVNNLQDPILRAATPAAISFGRAGGVRQLILPDLFEDPFSSGRIARFHLDPNLAAAMAADYPEFREHSWLDVVLFDQPSQGAPLTAANLERYAQAGLYAETFLHRLVADFVLQGGGFVWPGDELSTSNSLVAVPTFDAVVNEFSAARSNLRGTVAMAKLGSDPNSATSQWFFNLVDNSANLDGQNGGFTVFGRLRSATDLLLMDVLGSVQTVNAGGVFSDLPLYKLGDKLDPTDLLRFRDVEILQEPALSFEVAASESDDFQVQLDDSNVLTLQADVQPVDAGQRFLPRTSTITLTATNLLGETVQHSLDVITGWTADLDRNGVLDPLSDGLLITQAATGEIPVLVDPLIQSSLQLGLQDGHLDLDGNSRFDAVDAQLILRFGFGTFPGESLVAGAGSSSSQLTDPLISEKLQVLMA